MYTETNFQTATFNLRIISRRAFLTSAAYKRDNLFDFICRIIDRSENIPEPKSEEYLFTLFAEETYLSFIHSTLWIGKSNCWKIRGCFLWLHFFTENDSWFFFFFFHIAYKD